MKSKIKSVKSVSKDLCRNFKGKQIKQIWKDYSKV